MSVSCSSTTACTAVGRDVNSPIVEHWDGARWTVQRTPNPRDVRQELNDVSCTSRAACTAVGNYVDADRRGFPLVERWNGTRWALQWAPPPKGALGTNLSAVSCAATTSCVAVGTYHKTVADRTEYFTFAEHWDGSGWKTETTPSIADASSVRLTDVSCTSPTSCTAVGNHDVPEGGGYPTRTLAMQWNGTRWELQATPNPSSEFDVLESVSCTAANACTAVGDYWNPHSVALVERWDGVRWTLQSAPNPAEAEYTFLEGVSCTSAIACTAVGSSYSSAGSRTLAERWDGHQWIIETTPNRTDLATFNSVSCRLGPVCTAVGFSFGGQGPPVTLAARRA